MRAHFIPLSNLTGVLFLFVLFVCWAVSHLENLSRGRVLGGPDDHHGVPAKLDDVAAVPSHHVDQHGEVLVRVRLQLLRVQPGAEPGKPGDVREQKRCRKPWDGGKFKQKEKTAKRGSVGTDCVLGYGMRYALYGSTQIETSARAPQRTFRT